jgi:hypothetical protein
LKDFSEYIPDEAGLVLGGDQIEKIIHIATYKERERIVELIENGTESIAKTWVFSNAISATEFKTDDGTDAVSVDDAWLALEAQLNWLLQEIKGEK